MSYRTHPIADLFPMMSDDEIANQAEDIKKNGLLHPILLFEDKILDGRNRYKSCSIAGVEPHFKTFTGTFSEAMSRVWSENVQRRHLTSFQCAAIVVAQDELVERIAAEAKKRREATEGRPSVTESESSATQLTQLIESDIVDESADDTIGRNDPTPEPRNVRSSDAILAKTAGTNRQYINEVNKIKKTAPDVLEMAQKGEINRDEAKKLSRLGEDRRKEVIKKINTGTPFKKSMKAAAENEVKVQSMPDNDIIKPIIKQESYEMWLGNQDMCDLLITDPPYITDVDDVYVFAEEWLPMALNKVKSTGRAYVCIGAYPDELNAYITAAKQSDMVLANILVWTYRNTLGPSPNLDYKQNWQAILYFRGSGAQKLNCPLMTEQFSVQDINAPDGRLGNRYHKWQKPDELAERLIRHSTSKGDLVLDPFAGTGTFLLAATRLGRNATGCDSNTEILKIADKRGCQIEWI